MNSFKFNLINYFSTVLGLCCCAQAFSSCGIQASHYRGFSYSSADFVVVVHGLIASRHVESSQTRNRTHVPYIGRWILNHRTTREVLFLLFCWWGSWEWYHTHWWPLSLIRPSLFFQKLLLCFRTWLAQTSLLWLAFPRSEVEQENSTLPMARVTWVFWNKNH